jgi:C1A family cysteine protease
MCTPIKDQGTCGGCYAFSATETVESAIAIYYNQTPVEYSPQQLIDCSRAYGNAGCDGGWYYWAWNYMMTNPQETEASYPYTFVSWDIGLATTCTANPSLGVVLTASPTNYVAVGQTNADIISAINLQPVSVAIDSESTAFMNYTGGVITSGCGTTITHAVVAVGYGTDTTTGQAYFLIRNSWGATWGLNGFVYIGQSPTGTAPGYCAVNTTPYYPNAIPV